MAPDIDAKRLAGYMQMLKDRSGRSFDALGRRAGVSGSSLHRYCAGTTVPTEFASLLAFGKACGATRDELRELQRLWVLADADRDRSRADPESLDDEAPVGSDENGPHPERGTPETRSEDEPPDAQEIAAEPGQPDAGPPDADPPGPTGGPFRGRRSKVALLTASALVVLLGVAAGTLVWSTSDSGTGDDRLLLSAACHDSVSLGQRDECAREVQRLLTKAGARMAVDGSFGPETQRHLVAFQVLAGLTPRGVADEATKRALYEQKVSLRTWSAAKVEQRIRQVFVEEPDLAVQIADCQSHLDPHWSMPNPDSTRNWGVFIISQYRLTLLHATPAQALDPEWNIQTAYQLWKAHPDFRDWPDCAAAAGIPRPSTPAPASA